MKRADSGQQDEMTPAPASIDNFHAESVAVSFLLLRDGVGGSSRQPFDGPEHRQRVDEIVLGNALPRLYS